MKSFSERFAELVDGLKAWCKKKGYHQFIYAPRKEVIFFSLEGDDGKGR